MQFHPIFKVFAYLFLISQQNIEFITVADMISLSHPNGTYDIIAELPPEHPIVQINKAVNTYTDMCTKFSSVQIYIVLINYQTPDFRWQGLSPQLTGELNRYL